jgi:hypothetical protein
MTKVNAIFAAALKCYFCCSFNAGFSFPVTITFLPVEEEERVFLPHLTGKFHLRNQIATSFCCFLIV